MGDKLSHKLLDLGFFSALGTSEHPGMRKEEVHVKRQSPYTYDYNNGVMVIHDDEGRPWIIRGNYSEDVGQKIQALIEEHKLRRGAYVPHSNDGGHFVHEVLPNL